MRKVRLFTFLFLIYLLPNFTVAQITIRGFVLNDSTKAPVVYANVAIKGYPIGASTNEAGEFSFHFSNKYINDTLSISAIGFKSYECVISKIANADSIVILLDEQVYELSDAIVIPDNQLKDIIHNVTKSIRKNYPKHKYLLNGFYRELVLKDNTYTRLIEAAIDIQEPRLNSENGNLVRVNELRKSNSYVEYDWKSKLFDKIFGEDNQLYSILNADIIYTHDKTPVTKDILTNEFIKNYDFVLENISMMDSVKVYKIRFFSKKYYEQFNNNFSVIENHWISVRADNYAIIKYEFKLQIVKNFDKLKSVNFEDNSIFSATAFYKEYKGKYYPYLFDYMKIANAKGADKNTGKGKQYMKATLLINNILTKRKEYDKIKEKFSSPKDVELYNLDYKYHPEFWKNYNILKLNPLYTQVKTDIGKETPLEEQFIQNGK